jgi:hypothetical protein
MEHEQSTTAPHPARRVLWAADLCARWGVSLCTLWRWRRAGRMPVPDFMETGWTLPLIEEFEGGLRSTREPGRPPRSRPVPPARHK